MATLYFRRVGDGSESGSAVPLLKQREVAREALVRARIDNDRDARGLPIQHREIIES